MCRLHQILKFDKNFTGCKDLQKETCKFKHIEAKEFEKYDCIDWNIRIITRWRKDWLTTEEKSKDFINEWKVITIPNWWNANIKYHDWKFVDCWNIIATSIDENKYSTKYIYYVLSNNIWLIESYFQGWWLKHPNMKQIINIELKIPDIETQLKIVKTLDKFTELQAELQAELQNRKKQYTYIMSKIIEKKYNNLKIDKLKEQILKMHQDKKFEDLYEYKILCEKIPNILNNCINSFDNSKKLWEFIKIITWLNPRDNFRFNMNWNNYYVTIKEIENWNLNFTENTDRLDDESLNMINKYCKLENWNILLSRIWSVWKTYLIKNYMNNYNISETIYCLKIINKELLPKYLNYFLNIDSTQKYLKWNLRAWLLKSLKRETVKNINLILYDIETTNWLLKIFDLFYKLSQDINNWINLEIKLLNKQYKYYLNKLLTF